MEETLRLSLSLSNTGGRGKRGGEKEEKGGSGVAVDEDTVASTPVGRPLPR